MNKAVIDQLIPKAYTALEDFGVAKNGKIIKTYRGYISSFGAAVVMGSLRAAIAFNSKGSDSKEIGPKCDRDILMKIIYYLIKECKVDVKDVNGTSLLKYVIDNPEKEDSIKEAIYNSAIAVKLAMNMYDLVEETK